MNTTEGMNVSDTKIDIPTEIVKPSGDGVENTITYDVAGNNFPTNDRYDQFRQQRNREYGDQRREVVIISAPQNYYSRDPITSTQRRHPSDDMFDVAAATFEAFNDKRIRNRFIRNVYIMLTILLGFTSIVIGLFVHEPSMNYFGRTNVILGAILLIPAMIVYFILVCYESARKTFPLNIVLLAVHTVVASISYGILASNYSPDVVFYSALITAGVCLLITLLACQPWIDVTGFGAYLCIFGFVISIFGTIVMFVYMFSDVGKTLYIVYASLAALFLSMYFMFITQLIIGGRRLELSPDEYVLAVIILYTDIMSIFIYVLGIFGIMRN